MNDQKAVLRKELLNIRNQMMPEAVEEKSKKIFSKLKGVRFYREAKGVLVYSSYKNEVNTEKIIADLEDKRKDIYLPVMISDCEFIACKNNDLTKKNRYGIAEPVPVETCESNSKKLDLVICPGVGFDHQLFRLGFGKGNYDRFLAGSDVFKIGLCYETQIVKSVYPDSHDIPMDIVITEKRIYRRRR